MAIKVNGTIVINDSRVLQNLGSPITVSNGGTGLSSFTSGGILYASSSSALTTGSAVTYDGTTFGTTGATNLGTAAVANKIGLGTTNPDASFKVTISGNSGSTSPGIFFDDQAASPKNYVLYTNGNKNFVLRNQTDTSDIWTATPTGNLGLGVTPSPSGFGAGVGVAFDISTVGTLISAASVVGVGTDIGRNYYYNGTNNIYKVNGGASKYSQSAGIHSWHTAPAGTAGNAISFTQAMTLDASGRLGVGLTNPDSMVEVNSSTNAHARFKVNYNGSALAYFGSYSGIVGSGNATDTMLSSQAVLAFGAGGTTERARITATGEFLVGGTSTVGGSKFLVAGVSSAAPAVCQGASGGGAYLDFFNNGATSNKFRIGQGFSSASDNIALLYNDANAALVFGTNNAERARITAAGDVGIGTSSPGQKLEVAGNIFVNTSGNPYAEIKTSGAGNNPYLKLTADTNNWIVQGTFSNANDELMFQYNSSTLMALTKDGNLGVGTSSPQAISATYRTIEGSGADGAYLLLKRTSATAVTAELAADGGAAYLSSKTNHPIIIRTNDTERARITSGGDVGIGTSSPAYKLDVSGSAFASNWYAPDTAFTVGTVGGGVGIIGYGSTGSAGTTNTLLFQANGEKMRLDSSGNLGIGTNSPAQKLHVAGNFRTTNCLIENTSTNVNFGTTTAGYLAFLAGSGVERARIADSGNVGIGTTNPGTKFHVVGTDSLTNGWTRVAILQGSYPVLIFHSTAAQNKFGGIGYDSGTSDGWRFWGNASTSDVSATTPLFNILNNGNVGIGTATPGARLDVAGDIRATSNITAYYSDDRLKTRLGNIENALDKVCSLTGFYYEANELAQSLGYKPKREVGLSAQDMEKVLPEIVTAAPIDEKYKTMYYERVSALLVEAIKEIASEIKDIKKRLRD